MNDIWVGVKTPTQFYYCKQIIDYILYRCKDK